MANIEDEKFPMVAR